MDFYKCGQVVSLTFGDQGENHVGMKMVGKMVEEGEGFSVDDLVDYMEIFDKMGAETEIHGLNILYYGVDGVPDDIEDAGLLVVRGGLELILSQSAKSSVDLFNEMNGIEWDRHYYDTRRKKVLKKHARANVCFGEERCEPNYADKNGRVVAYDDVPSLKAMRSSLHGLLGEKCGNLICEGNQYFDLKKCGIGWHGDAERRKVVATRLGETMDLRFNWFYQSKSIGELFVLKLNHGDIYFMSEKAVGWDWKYRSRYTLRHSAGKEESRYVQLTK